MEAARLYGKKR
jgi:hypothetical protein